MAGNDPITAEQLEDALTQLRQQWQSGRLDPAEHERRTTAVRRAHTSAELDDVLSGLPALGGASGPVLSGLDAGRPVAPAGATVAPGGPETSSVLDRDDDGRTDGLLKLPRNTAGTIMALTPLIAVALFFLTGVSWVIFLAIPIMAILLFGPDGKPGSGSHDQGNRAERRQRRRDDRS